WNDIRRGSNQQTHKGTYSAIATSKTGPNKGIYDSVQLYCNMQQPNSVRTPGHEYTNVLDLAACEFIYYDLTKERIILPMNNIHFSHQIKKK
ncbi:hypothetical protein scyTo_0021494, partial [Scyliorhinus torazame]|nr:hypothetical protein [Scyliorhinus torazame]